MLTNISRRFVGACSGLPTREWGDISVESVSFTPASDGDLVVYFGAQLDTFTGTPVVRIHSECVFAEVLGSTLCDCDDQLQIALSALHAADCGVLVYLRYDGRGAGLAAKVRATALEIEGVDTYDSRRIIGVAPEGRSFGAVGAFLRGKGVSRVKLLTNNPGKASGLESAGIHCEVAPLVVSDPSADVAYLYKTKRDRFGHDLP